MKEKYQSQKLREYEKDLKEKLAVYPWVDEEMS